MRASAEPGPVERVRVVTPSLGQVDGGATAVRQQTRPVGPRRLGGHDVVWSKSGKLVAANEDTACGPPGNGSCQVRSWLRVVSVVAPSHELRRAESELFGFRGDSEWIVIRDGEHSLEEWSARTNEKRPSAFVERTRDASSICLSPDDDHFVATLSEEGPTVVRSRTATDETLLDQITFAPLPPSDCAFSLDGAAFALAGEHHVAIYRMGEGRPRFWLPLSNVSHLTWGADGRLSFIVREGDTPGWLVYQWNPQQARLTAHQSGGPAAFHPRRAELLTRMQCEWHRHSTNDGKHIGRSGPAAKGCFHVSERDIVVSPTGQFVAALEGEWSSRNLVLLPLP